MFIVPYFSVVSDGWENSEEKSEWLSKKSIHNFTDSDYLSNHRSMCKKSWGNTIICRFLQSISFHIQRKDGVHTTNIWSPQRNCYCYNGALQKHESNVLFTWWYLLFLWHWSFAWRYISAISIHNLPRLCTMKVGRSNKRKWFHKIQNADDVLQKVWQMQTMQMI